MMSYKDVPDLFKAAAVNWVQDHAQSMGAALAFYTMFSIAPLLLIVIAVAGLVFGEEAARGEIFNQLDEWLGTSEALAVQGLIESAGQPARSVLASVFGFVLLFIGATSVFAELQDALDRIWRAPAKPGKSGLWKMVRARLLSFGMILGIGFLLMVSLAFSVGLTALSKWWNPLFGDWTTVANTIEVAFGIILSTAVFAIIYKTMPRVRIDWRDVWIGAIVTSLLFIAGKFLIGTYIGKTGISSGFGAAASLVVVLLWVYYSAQIFLFGAEFTWTYSHQFGSRKGQPLPVAATTLPAPSLNHHKIDEQRGTINLRQADCPGKAHEMTLHLPFGIKLIAANLLTNLMARAYAAGVDRGRNIAVRAVMIRGAGFFGFWLLLIGPDPVDLAAGLFAAAAATWTSLRLLPPNGRHWQYAALARFAVRFLQQSIIGGLDVARRALDPRLPLRPGFVAYPVRLPPGPARYAFGALTSALPGTLSTGSNKHGALIYHCLDVDQPVAAQLAIDEGLLTRALGGADDDT